MKLGFGFRFFENGYTVGNRLLRRYITPICKDIAFGIRTFNFVNKEWLI